MLHAENIHKTYDTGQRAKPVLHGVDLSVQQGDFISVVGRSGSGKSTLLHVLSSLLQPDEGVLSYKGRNVTAMSERDRNELRKNDFAVVFQFHYLLPYLTALENTVLPHMQSLRGVPRQYRERAEQSLERVGLADKRHRLPSRLSGGEQQRVAIARALVKRSAILFADEPTGSLDRETGQDILALLQKLNKEGLTIVMVTHEEDYARLAHRMVRMEDGSVLAA